MCTCTGSPKGKDVHGGSEGLGLALHAGGDLAGGGLPEEVLEGVDESLGSDVAGTASRGVEEEGVVRGVVLASRAGSGWDGIGSGQGMAWDLVRIHMYGGDCLYEKLI